MRKGMASVGATVVGRRWVLRWEETMDGTLAATMWLDGGKSESLREGDSQVQWEQEETERQGGQKKDRGWRVLSRPVFIGKNVARFSNLVP